MSRWQSLAHLPNTYQSNSGADRRWDGSTPPHEHTHRFSLTKLCQNAVREMSAGFPECYVITANVKEVDSSSAPSSSRQDLYACTLIKCMQTHFPIAVFQPCIPLSTRCISNQAWQRTPQVFSVLAAALGPAPLCVLRMCVWLCVSLVYVGRWALWSLFLTAWLPMTLNRHKILHLSISALSP